jgi:hypothetical protein
MDALRDEVNEWRMRAAVVGVEEPGGPRQGPLRLKLKGALACTRDKIALGQPSARRDAWKMWETRCRSSESCTGRQKGGSEVRDMGCTAEAGNIRVVPGIS